MPPIHPDSPLDIEQLPPEALDGAWARAARESSRRDRERLLARADRTRGDSPEAAARARACYLVLRDDLDPSRPEGAERIRFVFLSSALREPEVEVLAERAARAAGGELRDLARLVGAEAAADLGRPEEAEERFRALLVEHRGRGTSTEWLVCRDLAWFYLTRFREVEALALARRTVALSETTADPRERCASLSSLCGAYRALSDWERLEETLELLEAALEGASAEAGKVRALLHGYRAEAALERGDLAGARKCLDRMREAVPPGPADAFDHRWPLHLEAAIALREGRWTDGREAVRRGLALPGRVPSGRLRLALLEVQLVLEGEGPAAALPLARRMLDDLEPAPGPDRFGPGNRLRFGTVLGDLLKDRCRAPEDARRAFDIAAGAVLRRLAQVDRTVRDMPEFAALNGEDLRILAEYRRRCLATQKDLSIAAAVLLEEAIAAGRSPLEQLATGEGLVTVCAWCRRVRDRSGGWVPVGVFLLLEDSFRITHGICPDCLDSVRPARD